MIHTLRGVFALAIALGDGDAPPAEFRIFRAGPNKTRKGTFVFDDAAARSVMSDYEQHGVDLMIDLEHLSLDENKPHFDPNARGWFRLELRNGELWAVGVSWTDDGGERLRKKTQRYISPAFRADTKSGRVLRLQNVAITAMPATDDITPLVAANERGTSMEKILAALGLAPGASEEEVVAAIQALKDKTAASDTAAKATEAKAAETTQAMAARASAADELATEVKKLRADLDTRDVRDLILSNRTKCTPALEKWALTQSPDALKAFFASAPVVTATERKEPEGKGETKQDELTNAELAVCKATGADPKEFLAHRVKLAARAAEVI